MTPSSSAATSTCDLRDFVRWVLTEFEPSVRLPGSCGLYARSPGQTEPELYGTSDLACILYTLGRLRPSHRERGEWAAVFQSYQEPKSGWLLESDASHSPVHNTAFALASMGLLDLTPELPVCMGQEYADPRVMLETIDWRHGVYPGSHLGVGAAVIRALAPGLYTSAWFERYFAHCDSLIDPNNGMLGREKPPEGDWDQVGGTVHYLFLYGYFNRRMAYPERRIDSVLRLQQDDGYWHPNNHLWLAFDAVYMLTRSLRTTPHRFEDVRECVRRTLRVVERDFFSPEARQTAYRGRVATHALTAALSFAAEAQQFLGSAEVITEEPLRLLLDRRPFI